MKTLRRTIAGCLAPMILAGLPQPGWAQTWSGATDNNWSTATNWVGGAAPASNFTTSVTFDATASTFTPFTDLPWLLNRLDVLGAIPYTFSGNGITFDGTTPAISAAGAAHSFANPIGVPSALTITNTSALLISGSMGGGGTLTKLGLARLTLTGGALPGGGITIGAGTLRLGDGASAPGNAPAIVNNGALETQAPVGILVNGPITGSGTLTVLAGVLGSFAGTVFSHAGTTTVNAGGQLDTSLANNALLTLDGTMNTALSSVGSLAGSGNLNINGAGSVFTVGSDNTSTTFSGGLLGGGGLTKVGTGQLTLAVSSMPGGPLTISSGTLRLGNGGPLSGIADIVNNGALLTDAFAVSVNGSFTGSGTLTILNGLVAQFGPPFTYTGNTTITSAGRLDATLVNNALLTIDAGGIMNTGSSTVGSLAGGGNLSVNSGTFTFGVDNTSTTFSGGIFGIGALTRIGTGLFIHSGTALPGGTITISSGTVRLGDGLAGPNFVAGNIVVNGALETNRIGGIAVNGSITGSGTLTVLGGLLAMFGPPFTHTGTTTVNAGAQLDASIINNARLTLNGLMNTANLTVGSLAGSGQLNLNSINPFTVGGDNTSTTFSGAITGIGNLVKVGTGRLTLSGVNTYAGGTTVNAGALAITGDTPGPIVVNAGGTLMGTGAIIGPVTVNAGGTLSPGLTPGQLFSFDIAIAGTLVQEIEGTTLGTQYDNLDVGGTVTLTGATLTLAGAYVPATGDSFVVIINDQADAVVGTFAGLPEGATLPFNGRTLRITYVGGDGNDVVLLAVAPFPGNPAASIPTLSEWGLAILATLMLLAGGFAARRRERRPR